MLDAFYRCPTCLVTCDRIDREIKLDEDQASDGAA